MYLSNVMCKSKNVINDFLKNHLNVSALLNFFLY